MSGNKQTWTLHCVRCDYGEFNMRPSTHGAWVKAADVSDNTPTRRSTMNDLTSEQVRKLLIDYVELEVTFDTTREKIDARHPAMQILAAYDALRQQLAALTLTWTDEKPTEVGHYWYRRNQYVKDVEQMYVEELVLYHGQLISQTTRNPPANGQWAGPIHPPKEG